MELEFWKTLLIVVGALIVVAVVLSCIARMRQRMSQGRLIQGVFVIPQATPSRIRPATYPPAPPYPGSHSSSPSSSNSSDQPPSYYDAISHITPQEMGMINRIHYEKQEPYNPHYFSPGTHFDNTAMHVDTNFDSGVTHIDSSVTSFDANVGSSVDNHAD